MSKSSQESSPITQWRERVLDEIKQMVNHGDHWDCNDDCLEKFENRQSEARITSATIELMTQIIGEDEPLPTSLFDWKDDDQRKYWYNKHRADLRQSLKELSDLTNKEN
jgi:hypothetical protein